MNILLFNNTITSFAAQSSVNTSEKQDPKMIILYPGWFSSLASGIEPVYDRMNGLLTKSTSRLTIMEKDMVVQGIRNTITLNKKGSNPFICV